MPTLYKKKFSSIVAFLALSALLIVVFLTGWPEWENTTNLFSAQVEPATDEAASLHPVIEDHQNFLLLLYNGLVEEGEIPGPALKKGELWEKLTHEADVFVSAVYNYFEAGGGFITAERVYAPHTSSVQSHVLDHQTIGLSIDDSELLVKQRTVGVTGDHLRDIHPLDPDIGYAVAVNLDRIFAREVRATGLSSEGYLVTDAIDFSKVWDAVRDYLEQLVSGGLLVNFELDPTEYNIEFQLPDLSYPSVTRLALWKVNSFSSIDVEADFTQEFLNFSAATHTFLRLDSNEVSAFSVSDFHAGAEALLGQNFSDPKEARQAFFAAQGLAHYLSPEKSSSKKGSSECTYGPGTVTPCNNQVVALWGFDHNGAMRPNRDGFQHVLSALGSNGYKRTQIVDFRGAILASKGEEDRLRKLRKLKEAETLMMAVHGSTYGSMVLACYDDVQGFNERNGLTLECCERMKAVAGALDLRAAGEINCTSQSSPSFDRTVSILATSTGEARCATSTGEARFARRGKKQTNRCKIMLLPRLYRELGEKAAVFTHQCYGGSCTNLRGVGTSVKDYYAVSAGAHPVWQTTLCDDEQLASDLLGQAYYCVDRFRDIGHMNWERNWQAFSSSCTGAYNGYFPAAPSSLRSISDSYDLRGSADLDPWPLPWEELRRIGVRRFEDRKRLCNTMEFSNRGFKKYNHANVGGDPNTSVEFWPSVMEASYHEGYLSVSIPFTSAIDTGSCSIEVEKSEATRLKVSSNKIYESKSCDKDIAIIQLSGDPRPLSRNQWGKDPAELRAIYGADQSNWPWYISIKVRAKAPNSVDMVGNAGAAKKWIWPAPRDENLVPPYLGSLGMLPQGGNVFEVHIPVEPSMACCIPFITWDTPPDGSKPTPEQNGCKCADSGIQAGKDFCFTGTCVTKDSNGVYYVSAAEAMDPSHCAGDYRRFDGEWHIWHDCCEVKVGEYTICEMTDSQLIDPVTCEPGTDYLSERTWFQYIERPWDESEVQQCEVIESYTTCASH